MTQSLITNIERRTGQVIAAAPDGGVLLTSGPLGWRGITAELHRIEPYHQPEHFVQTHRLMIHIGAPARFEFREAGNRWQANVLQAGDLSLVGHGLSNEPRWHDRMDFMAIGLDPAFVAASFGDALPGGVVQFAAVRGRADPVAAGLTALLRRELAVATFAGGLFGETVALAFARHLFGHYGVGLKDPRGALTGAQLARVIDYLHANLAEDIGLETLAAQAYVSPFHFARLFRAATGLSPHQFVLRLRIDLAKRLILSPARHSLTDISAAAGFFDQAHFTKAFKRLIGTTPSGFAASS